MPLPRVLSYCGALTAFSSTAGDGNVVAETITEQA
jgi:hypothetical protein